MAAAIPFMPMILGAGAGALMNKQNPLKGAMLGAVGGSIAGPAIGAMTGLGTAGAAAASTAALPAQMASNTAVGGLPSMASVVGTMPGGMAMPGLMAGGSTFGANAAALGTAYNALPMAERLGILTKEGMGGLFKMPSEKMAMKMGSGLLGGGQEPPPAMPSPPPRMPVGQTPMIQPMVTSMLNRRRYNA